MVVAPRVFLVCQCPQQTVPVTENTYDVVQIKKKIITFFLFGPCIFLKLMKLFPLCVFFWGLHVETLNENK